MKQEQLTLFPNQPELKPTSDYQKRKWFNKFAQYCQDIYEEKGSLTGLYCCGYHWCCDECYGTLCNGCRDCVKTMKTILKEHNVFIDYNDYDFAKWERIAKETYYKAKGWKYEKEN